VRIAHGRTLRLADGTQIVEQLQMQSVASRRDPSDARAEGETRVRRTSRGSTTEVNALGILASTATAFDLAVELEVRLDGRPHFHRRWEASFPRLLL
jgi:hypothetical protein